MENSDPKLSPAGSEVAQGDTLMVIEAMKMEHGVVAPRGGVVESVRYTIGDTVEEGAELIVFEAAEEVA